MDAALQKRLDYVVALLAGLFVAVFALGYGFFGLQYFSMFLFVLVVGAALVALGGLLTVDLREGDANDADD